MKINRNIQILVFALAATYFMSGCTRLDDKVYSTIVADKYHYTENDLVRLLGNAYTPWRSVVDQALTTSQEISTDEELVPVKPWGWNGTTTNMHLHTWTSETGEATGRWGELYSGITNTNQLIYQLSSGLVPLDAGEKQRYLAELRVLRASYYYLLDDYYGNVPYVTRWDLPKGYLPEQISRTALTDSIIGEVKADLPYLDDKVDQTTYGRMTKWGAFALLAKMCINAGVYTGKPMWEDCIAACDSIINSGKFALDQDPEDPFKADNETSTEAVFAIPFDQSYAGGLNIFNYALNGQFNQVYQTVNGFGGWGGNVAVPQFVSTYDPQDSRLADDYLMGQQKYPDGSNVLCEEGESVGKPMDIVNMVPGLAWAEEYQGYHLAKYQYVSGMTAGAMSNDVFVFRYTDVLMMKAECLLRTGHADEAAAIVTKVRGRAFKSDPAKAIVTGAELRQGSSYDYGLRETAFSTHVTHPQVTHEGGADIVYGRFLDELGWEFNQEGRRRQDMIRFETTAGEPVFIAKSWLSHKALHDRDKLLYPIPQSEIDKNPNLKQNAGY